MIINASTGSILHIGRVGENNATKVVFDISKWVEEYGIGEVTLVIEQNEVISLIGTTDPALQFEGDKVTWLVSDAFTKMEDRGKCELYYSINDVKVKSVLFDIVVTKSLDGYEEVPPTPYDGWINQLLDAAGEVSGAVEYAKQAKGSAEEAKKTASQVNEVKGEIDSIKSDIDSIKSEIDSTAEEVNTNASAASSAAKNAKTSAESAQSNAETIQEQIALAKQYAGEAEASKKAIEEQIPSINQNAIIAADAAQEAAEAFEEIKGLEETINQKAQEAIDTVNEFSETVDDAEAWAVGQRNGVDVPSTDETYLKNSKYYSQEAKRYRDEAKEIAGGDFASEAYVNNAIDSHNNSDNAHPDIRDLVNKAGSAEYVINQNNKEEKYYFWFGSQEEYGAIADEDKDEYTLYIVNNSLTEEEKQLLEEHLNDSKNPHGVTAEQVNAYTKEEIIELLANGTPAPLHADTHKANGIDPLQLSIEQIEGLQNTLNNKAPSEHIHGVADITDFPTIPSWALEETKPTYTAAEVDTYTKLEIDNLISSAVNNAIGDALGGSY